MFYLLSLITGILECGWIAHGVVYSLPLWQILCFPLAYHLGNLCPKPFSLSGNCLRIMCAVSFLTGGLTLVWRLPEEAVFILTCVTLFLLSAVIQSVRSGMKRDGNKLLKRVFRVGGFALAPLAILHPSVILLLSSAAAAASLRDHSSSFGVCSIGSQKGFSLVMLFHQLHYFFYAHITLAAVSCLLFDAALIKGVVIAALLFCETWITYMSVEPLVSMLTERRLPVFFAGHIGISILLAVMSTLAGKPIFSLLWVLTGLGGGTVFTITDTAKAAGCYDKDSMTVSENIGHTLGLLVTVAFSVIAGAHAPVIMLILGSASALLAVISMTVLLRKEKRHEVI